MDDKNIMEDLLVNLKGLCDLYIHATTEAATLEVYTVFKKILDDILCLQQKTYSLMEKCGYYQVLKVEENKISQIRNKFIN